MDIRDEILINQLAQGVQPMTIGEVWFTTQGESFRVHILHAISHMILHAHPVAMDITEAIARSGLKSTATQCVLARKSNTKLQLSKIVNLRPEEQSKSFRFLVTLLGVADARRRLTEPLDLVNHWWHKDLADSKVVADIISIYDRADTSF